MPASTDRPTPHARRRAWFGAGALLLAALVAGCGQSGDKFAPTCPVLTLAPDAGTMTRFASLSHDPASVIMAAEILAVPAKCAPGGTGKIKSTLNVAFQFIRGPAATSATQHFVYFVGVAEGETVLQEQDFPLTVTLPAAGRTAALTDDDIELIVPVSKTKSAAAYHIFVGFRLTPDELAFNRARAAH